jgi:hypothetical protein
VEKLRLCLVLGWDRDKVGYPIPLYLSVWLGVLVFLRITQYNVDTHNTHAHSSLWTHIRKTYPYENLRKTKLADLEIHEVTTDALMSTGTMPTESIAPLNPGINPENVSTCAKSRTWTQVDRFHHNQLIYDQFTYSLRFGDNTVPKNQWYTFNPLSMLSLFHSCATCWTTLDGIRLGRAHSYG